MNLLFDQNISFRIIELISSQYPDAKQVREVNLENASDIDIWKFAKNNDFCIVTFDSDFIDISNLRGAPPKIIWLRIGNTSTQFVAQKLQDHRKDISEFIINNDVAFLEIN